VHRAGLYLVARHPGESLAKAGAHFAADTILAILHAGACGTMDPGVRRDDK
jgi:hypothetical protein